MSESRIMINGAEAAFEPVSGTEANSGCFSDDQGLTMPDQAQEVARSGRGALHSLLQTTEASRRRATLQLKPESRAQMGQFFTPASVATFMAGMSECKSPKVRVLDPGAGTGALSAALVLALSQRRPRPKAIDITAYEVDSDLIRHLRATLQACQDLCEKTGISFRWRVEPRDFLEVGASAFRRGLFVESKEERYECAILNPPYRKIHTGSTERKLLRSIGLETTNLYTGFLAVTSRFLTSGGEMIAITPRSFCNGPYFEPFRRFFLGEMRFRRIHVFDTRDRAFSEDDVLQENVVFRAVRSSKGTDPVVVSASSGPSSNDVRARQVVHDELVRPTDPHAFIHIAPNGDSDDIRKRLSSLKATISDLGLTVSTGRVVDFRAKHFLRAQPAKATYPLIYPCHMRNGFIEWPNDKTRKPNALASGAKDLLVPQGNYVLTKRFTAKEEPRRVVAAIYDLKRVAATHVAFENHLNYFHMNGAGMPIAFAKGLTVFLNSSLVDAYFRQFSGHTQVNATDLRSLNYPTRTQLLELGRRVGKTFPSQDKLDDLIDETLFRA